jgi:hypothetical protein
MRSSSTNDTACTGLRERRARGRNRRSQSGPACRMGIGRSRSRDGTEPRWPPGAHLRMAAAAANPMRPCRPHFPEVRRSRRPPCTSCLKPETWSCSQRREAFIEPAPNLLDTLAGSNTSADALRPRRCETSASKHRAERLPAATRGNRQRIKREGLCGGTMEPQAPAGTADLPARLPWPGRSRDRSPRRARRASPGRAPGLCMRRWPLRRRR